VDHVGDSRGGHEHTSRNDLYERTTIIGWPVGALLGVVREGDGGMSPGTDEGGSPVEPDTPRTLAGAQHAVASCRPSQQAPLAAWLAYHQRAAAWYAEVAEIDRGHHHEALALAEEHRQLAKKIKTQIPAPRPVGEEKGE
jgi:hypothetical protein